MNYTDEQIKKALRQFIDDPDTAKKFAAAMREGLRDVDADEDAEANALYEINKQLKQMMLKNGFEDQSTGGGCWGWFKNLLPDGSMYLQITVGDSQLIYDTLADAHQQQVCACVYINGEWQDQTLRYYTFEELKAVMKESI